jgi:acetyl esterase/lipase
LWFGAPSSAATTESNKKDLSYGPHERNVIDLWLAKGVGPRPLVVYIHGGGWLNGDKKSLREQDLQRFLDAGVSVAAINYRFSNHAPYPAPMRDAGLAIQFLRHHAKRYNLDALRVGAYGGSAGAVTSMWLGFGRDLAEPDSSHPVLRHSTRLTCVGSIVGPTTLDKQTMDDWFGMKVVPHPAFYPFYDVENEDDLYSPRVRKIGAEASPINRLSADDPPVFLAFPQDLADLPKEHTAGQMVHHPLFGVRLKEAADKIGVEAVFEARNRPQDRYKDLTDFMIQKLTAPWRGVNSARHPDALPNTHAPGEVDRPEMLAYVVPDTATLEGVVLDETLAELEGEWQYSTHTPPHVGYGYLHDMKQGKGAKSVTYRATLPQDGLYEVRVSHCYNVRRATNTPIRIGHADGVTMVRINQQEEAPIARLFRPLGRYRFEKGAEAWVRISNEGTSENKVVIADAVQFIWVEE